MVQAADDDRWAEWGAQSDDLSGHVLPFPGERLRRFVGIQLVRPDRWRAAVFIGWHVDPSVAPDRHLTTYADALNRAEKAAMKLGLPLIADRCSVLGRGVWKAPA